LESCGGSIYKQGEDSIHYQVSSLLDLTNVIIPHFEKYPLITYKRADFILFKQAVDLINRGEHLTMLAQGLRKLIGIKVSINSGLSEKLKKAFPNIIPVPRPLVVYQKIKDPNWFAGFTIRPSRGRMFLYSDFEIENKISRLRRGRWSCKISISN
jgi:hypothetical protein